MTEFCRAAVAGQLGPAGIILRCTAIDELYVLALAVGVFAVAWACLSRKLPDAALRRGFACFALLFLVGTVTFGLVSRKAFLGWFTENHVIEWLTADCLLVAWVLGLVLTVRLGKLGRHSPMAAFLTMGCFWGFWRELEWGKPLLGAKLIYTRHFFRIRPYLSIDYYDKLSSDKGVSSVTMFVMHWAAVLLALLLAWALIRYIIRHKEVFRQELQRLGKLAYGRYFLLAVAIGLGSNLLGAVVHKLARGEILANFSRLRGLPHYALEEPLELLATACLMMSIIALWQATSGGRRPVPTALDPAAGKS